MVSVSEGPYRLIKRAGQLRGELFDRRSDPREQRDVGDEQPEVRARLTALVRDYPVYVNGWFNLALVELQAKHPHDRPISRRHCDSSSVASCGPFPTSCRFSPATCSSRARAAARPDTRCW